MHFFVSHIGNRIPLPNQKETAYFIFAVIIIATVISVTRSIRYQHFLDRARTEQLKGIAILLIMIGHLSSHVTVKNWYIPSWFGTCGVYLFLFLSGYGLTCSHQSEPYTLKRFIQRRVNRVCIPYWITTVLFLTLDYLLLSEHYSLKLVLLTACGLNFTLKIQLLDCVRWFVPLILFCYGTFFIATRFRRFTIQLLVMVAAPIALCIANYFFFIVTPYHPFEGNIPVDPGQGGWNPWNLFIIPFPLGFLMAAYAQKRRASWKLAGGCHWWGLVFGALFLTLYLQIGEMTTGHSFNQVLVSSLMNNLSRTFLMLSVIFFFLFLSSFNLSYRVLSAVGLLSYETYLLHGAFMAKYDFILFRFPVQYSFFIFLGVIYIFASMLNKVSGLITSRI